MSPNQASNKTRQPAKPAVRPTKLDSQQKAHPNWSSGFFSHAIRRIPAAFWPSKGATLKRWTFFISLLAVICWWLTDWQIYAAQPGTILKLMLEGLVAPTVSDWQQLAQALMTTLAFAVICISVALVCGLVLSLYYRHRLVAALCSSLRAVHELFWALLLIQIFGLSWLTAILAVVLPYSAILARVFFDLYQQRSVRFESLFPGAYGEKFGLCRLSYELLPQAWPAMKQYLRYRMECAFRTAAILGFVGIPSLGYYLDIYFKQAHFAEAAAWLWAFIVLILSLRFWFRVQWLPVFFVVAILTLPEQQWAFEWHNLSRFLSEDIWPASIRNADSWQNAVTLWFAWAGQLSLKEALPGLWQTFALTTVALVLVLIAVQMQLAISWRLLRKPWIRPLIHMLLLLMRSVPEFILAFILLLIWGPSMLPAAVALAIHNGGLIGYLTTLRLEAMQKTESNSPGHRQSWFYYGLPQSFNGFLALLLYRAEIMFRESTILGILGVGSIGFFLDSAFEDFRLDKAFVLIIWLVIGNILFDALARWLQRRLTGRAPQVYSGQAD